MLDLDVALAANSGVALAVYVRAGAFGDAVAALGIALVGEDVVGMEIGIAHGSIDDVDVVDNFVHVFDADFLLLILVGRILRWMGW